MSQSIMNVFGRVRDPANLHGIAGLRVEVHSGDAKASAVTDERGAFTITIDQSRHPNLFTDNSPDVIFKFNVFDGETLINTTPKALPRDNKDGRFEIEIVLTPNVEPKPFVVRGQVRRDGHPLSGILIAAVDKDLRREEELGQAITDGAGSYEITYTADQFHRAEKGTADLIVRARDAAGTSLAASPIIFNASPVATVDLVVGDGRVAGLSEFEQLLEELAPLLEGLSPAELTEDKQDQDITFLAGETGRDRRHIEFLATAHRLTQQTGLPPEVFYGLFRQNLPTDLPLLLAQSRQLQRSALQTAIQQNTIPARISDTLDSILERFQQLRVERALQPSNEPTRPSLGDLLATVNSDRLMQEKFATLYLQHQGAMDDFWDSLHNVPEFNNEELINNFRFTFELAAITQNHLPMIRALQPTRRGDFRSSLRDLARRDIPDWVQLINQTVGDVFPPDVIGNSSAEKAENYANMIAGALEASFPTAVIARKLERDDFPHKDDLVRFFSNAPIFEFGSTPIQRYLSENPDALARVADREGTGQQLKTMERVFKLTPRYDEMRTLLADGLHSAQSIATLGSEVFLEKYGEKLGEERAAMIHDNATRLATTSLALYALYSTSLDSVGTRVAPSFVDLTAGHLDLDKELPEWKSLFGSLELCACEHCRSVLSPAAYLVDILNFLRNCPKGPTGKTPLQILLERRGDIQDIELSCENTNTPLPYIDLINEILENAIAPFGGAGVWQTRGTAEERRAIPDPEHVNPKADALLAEQVFPWDLPFDPPLEQVRLYLDQSGTRRHKVMETYLGRTAPEDSAKLDSTDIAIASEYLGLSDVERQIITGATPKTPQELWGYKPSESMTWIAEVAHVPEFLRRSGLTYLQLLEILDLRFIDPKNTIHIEPPGSCNTEEMTITAASSEELEAALKKIPRFVRIWRKLGWSMRDLDRAIFALKASDLDDAFLLRLSHMRRLSAEFDVPIVNMLTWCSPIDVFTYETPEIPKTVSLYEQLFANPAVLNPLDPVLASGPPGTEKIKEHVPVLLAAVQISADELALLTDTKTAQDTLQLTTSEVADNLLSLDNLSHLYRVASFSRALGLSLVNFLSAKALTGIDPFASTGDTLRFIAAVRKIGASPFSIEELDYFLRNAHRPSSDTAPSHGQIDLILNEIHDKLSKLDPAGEITKRLLSGFLVKPDTVEVEVDTDAVDRAISMIGDTSVPTAEEQTLRAAFIDIHFKAFMSDVDDAKTRLVRTGKPKERAIKDKAERFAYVLANLLASVKRDVSEQLVTEVTQPLVEALNLEPRILNDLLFELVKPGSGPSGNALAGLLDEVMSLSAPEPGADLLPRLYDLYARLFKVARIANGYAMSAKELGWIFQNGPSRGWLDLNKLPADVASSSPAQFSRWERLDDVFTLFGLQSGLRKKTESGNAELFKLFEDAESVTASAVELRERLGTLTGWQLTDETIKAVSLVKDLNKPPGYSDERGFLALNSCFDIAVRTGLSAKQLRALCEKTVTTDEAAGVLQAIHSGYKDGQALKAISPLSDALREKQRSALVSYLVFHMGFRRADDLFAHYLIDVEMSACQLTSRIKQANSSIQLFIQRALMNLEKDVSIPPGKARLWKWMKNYRVWEANRKVFLYPENWIEPDLRDDKTPFFKDLENELLQGEVTADAVESAYSNYLDQLDQVARLEICGFYHERLAFFTLAGGSTWIPKPEIIHVFGRTTGIPHIYYYRRRERNHWTAWERVDLDIEGDHLIPVVFEGRLYLFWAIITQKSVGKPPRSYWEVQLAWSTFHNNSWPAKRVSEASLALDDRSWFETDLKHVDKRTVFFKTKQNGAGLVISLLVHRRIGIATGITDFTDPEGEFRIEACRSDIVAHPDPDRLGDPVSLPRRTKIENMSFAEQEDSDGALWLPQAPSEVDTLEATPGRFSLVTPHQDLEFNGIQPFFFQDQKTVFFVTPERLAEAKTPKKEGIPFIHLLYLFETFYHPYTCKFIEPFNRYGIEGLLNPIPQMPGPKPKDRIVTDLSRQQMRDLDLFEKLYDPNPAVVKQPNPVEDIDFRSVGAYSQYNWELFFHIPLLVADQLSKNQRFEEAQQWFHYIFDPTDASSLPTPQRFWKVRPFFENLEVKHTIAKLMELLDHPVKDDADPLKKEKAEFISQVERWMENPFNPHLIARTRIAAYQKTVVMKYIENLIAWGDQLFRRDTLESINEATQLYVLAAAILGDRPLELPAHELKVKTYRDLGSKLDEFSNSVVELEGYVSAPKASPDGKSAKSSSAKSLALKRPEELEGLLAMGQTLYFCTPQNDALLRYWDTVANRLFKVHHCMNIEGVVRQLPLFEPPIDPALLVRATAAGLDLSSILNDLNLPLPNYRFSTMLQKAVEFCNDVKALGAALLSALEKKDAEALSRLRSGQENQLLNAVRQNKQKQIEEAQHALESLQKAKDMATLRHNYYTSREFTSDWEKAHLAFLVTSGLLQVAAAYLETGAAVTHILPEFTVGLGSPEATTGGSHVGSALEAASRALNSWSSVANTAAVMSATMGGYHRREDEWKLQGDLAAKETEQIDRQILGAEIRRAIAEQDLRNHDLQIKHAKEVDVQMRTKFTNRELYSWMISQISAVYFQSYRMAYDIAKRAERCYTFELGKQGNPDPGFLQPLYWDSLKKGLLAGEKLHYDLKRMEVAYLDQNKREYEITKSISLAMLNPIELIKLKESGECFVDLREGLFDMDYPGHYMRRIKSLSLTIPCVTGPYASVNCTITLGTNSVRKNPAAGSPYERKPVDDDRFVDDVGAIQSIATSSGQNDSGVFELNFRDERYLPFEGSGAISSWHIEMRKDCNQFDFNTISDVIFHLRYTARDGGTALKGAAISARPKAENILHLFSARHDFSSEWHRFLHPKDTDNDQTLQISPTPEQFPFQFRRKSIEITGVELFLKLKEEKDPISVPGKTYFEEYESGTPLKISLTPPGGIEGSGPLKILDGIPHVSIPVTDRVPATFTAPIKLPVKFVLTASDRDIQKIAAGLQHTVTAVGVTHHRLNSDAIEDILVVCHYSVK